MIPTSSIAGGKQLSTGLNQNEQARQGAGLNAGIAWNLLRSRVVHHTCSFMGQYGGTLVRAMPFQPGITLESNYLFSLRTT